MVSGTRLFFLCLLFHTVSYCHGDEGSACSLDVTFPRIILSSVPFSFTINLPAFLKENNESITIPSFVDIGLYEGNNTELLLEQDVDTRSSLSQNIQRVNNTLHLGYHTLTVKVFNSSNDDGNLLCEYSERLLLIPAWLTIFPPIITAVVAIVFRQVLLALLIGIWLAAFLGHRYDLFAALLRTLDTYIIGAMADHDHAAVIIVTFFLGGLIGIVQRSGGGLGLARVFTKFAKTTRRASLVCFAVSLLVFFDDYTCILITGNSLRTVMDSSGVSKDKFAFIVQSMAPSLASFIPISSWVGAQIGYVSSGFDSSNCGDDNKESPFNIVIKTLPYRFLPILMVYCVLLVCFLSRDFACMLTAERENSKKYQPTNPVQIEARSNSLERDVDVNGEELQGSSDDSDLEELFDDGPLAPKRGVPHRWFNAVIPFLIVIIVTFFGIVVGGWREIVYQNNNGNKISLTVQNMFGNADAISALIWSTCLATLVAVIMLLIQKILTFQEFMNVWIEGVKDVIEPLIILLLAWALGNVITEIQTSNFIAQALSGNLSAKYVPAITTIIGYFMAYATGSAYGTMGILFPLVIPTVCQLTPDESIRMQTAGAILSSCIYGNLMSPIADLTVLTRVATKCDLNSHLKTCSPYILLVGLITILFGALPVGAGWYPWWAAWILMPLAITLFFIVFSAGHSVNSRSLCRIGCPCLFIVLNKIKFKLAMKLNVYRIKYSNSPLCIFLTTCKRRSEDNINRENVNSKAFSVEEDYETAPLVDRSDSATSVYKSL